MPAIHFSGKQPLYWASTAALIPLTEANVPVVNIGEVIVGQFAERPPAKWPGTEIETFLAGQLKRSAIEWPGMLLPLVAIQNIGILFEPELTVNPTLWLKRLLKEYHVMLIWEGNYRQPGIFYWANSPNQYLINLAEAAPQPLLIPQ